MAVIEHDGFAIESTQHDDASLRAALGIEPEPAAADTPVEATPAQPADAKSAQPVANTEEPDPELDAAGLIERNADGTFKRKDPVKRIKELTAKWRGTERERDALKAELDALKAGQAAPKPAAVTQPVAAETFTFPSYTEWAKAHPQAEYEDYLDARSEARLEAKLAARDAAAQQAKQVESTQAAIARVMAAGTTAHPDFEDALATANAAGLQFPEAVLDAVFSDQTFGHELAYHLATHLEDFRRLVSLSPFAAAREVGKLLTRLEAAHSGPATETPVTSQAKAPIKPVGSAPILSDPLEVTDDLDADEHIRRMNARDQAARKR